MAERGSLVPLRKSLRQKQQQAWGQLGMPSFYCTNQTNAHGTQQLFPNPKFFEPKSSGVWIQAC
eukprot:1157035-Pelagomonas_calceolata.AAC.2